MQPLRQIFKDTPKTITIPKEFQHRPMELIMWPLDDEQRQEEALLPEYERTKVEHIVMPSREERNARH